MLNLVMFQSVVHLLTLFSILLHSLFGCCWHHSHVCACETHAVSARSTSPVDASSCPCGCDASAFASGDADIPRAMEALRESLCDPQSSDDSPCEPRHCDHDRCVYVNATVTMPTVVATYGWCLPALVSDPPESRMPWSAFNDPSPAGQKPGGASLRAFLQIWRI